MEAGDMHKVARVLAPILASFLALRFGVWATAEQIRFAYFRYTDGNGAFWSVKTDADWGLLAASGFSAFNAADPAWPRSARYRLRKCILQDPTTGLKTARPTGSVGAGANTRGTVINSVVRGSAGTVGYVSLGMINERLPKTGILIAAPDTTTT
jgi:hypothetical protein